MSRLRVLLSIMRASYLNKVRTYRFLILLSITIVAGYIFIPADDATYVTLGWGTYTTFFRGVYNSAWIGSQVAMLTGTFLTLLGFYVVNDSIKHDEETRVGQIIATAPIRNSTYTLGKTLCNFAVLSTIVAVVSLTTLGMQIFRGEDLVINLWSLIVPFLVFVLPLMFLVAAIAVLFETSSSLRGGLGNITYFFVWMIGLPLLSDSLDLFGINATTSSMRTAGLVEYPEMDQTQFTLGFSYGITQTRTLSTFTWQGLHWTLEILLIRILLMGFAVGITLIASRLFNRFDPSLESQQTTESLPPEDIDTQEVSTYIVTPLREVELRSLHPKDLQFSFASLLIAECRLALKELKDIPLFKRWTFIAIAALVVTGLILPPIQARGIVLLLAWFLPVLIWSKMGTRESRHQTEQLIFSSAHVLKRQLLAVWLAGVFLAIVTSSGVAMNLALHSDWFGLLALFVGALFIPSLALCFGVWTGSGKLFEFLYTMLWYIGPLSGAESLDFMGALPGSVEAGIWQFFLVITILILGLSFLGRKWQVQRD